ncbi:hypothetical protein ACFFRR_001258 [Megaselia abdita]
MDVSTPSFEETEILRRELRLLRQQSQQLIEQGKELVTSRRDEAVSHECLYPKVNVTWKFFIFVLLLILAFFGTLSQFRFNAPKESELARRLDEVTAQNEILRLEIENLFQIIERLKDNGNSEQRKDNRHEFPKDTERYRFTEQNNHKKPTFSRDTEKLRVWPGKGDSFDQIEIPKKDLKSSYNCGDNEEDVAGFCVASAYSGQNSKTSEPIVQTKFTEKSSYEKKIKHPKQQSVKKKYHSSEERKDKSSQSKERKYEKCKDCKNKHSGERKGKNKKNYSKEHDGDWHDNMMKNREKQRKHKEKREDNNWYMERGYGREQSRTAN